MSSPGLFGGQAATQPVATPVPTGLLEGAAPQDPILSRNMSYAKPGPYTTVLMPGDEQKFQAYLADKSDPADIGRQDGPDYDMRGWWKAKQAKDPRAALQIDPNDKLKHRNDYWKTPYHETFSNESQWALPGAPAWVGDKLVAPDGTVVFDDSAPKDGK